MSMTLLQAITHARETAQRLRNTCSIESSACASEHEQLAEWLEELRNYKETVTQSDAFIAGYVCAGGNKDDAKRIAEEYAQEIVRK